MVWLVVGSGPFHQSNHREPLEIKKFSRGLLAERRESSLLAIINHTLMPFVDIVREGGRVAAYWFGANLAMRGKLTTGDLSQFCAMAEGLVLSVNTAKQVRAEAESNRIAWRFVCVLLLLFSPFRFNFLSELLC